MSGLKFVKMQGTGNDFVVIDTRNNNLFTVEADHDLPLLVEKICDRHFGVGADGVIFVLPSDKADYKMRIINPDGSEAEMCGNGIRCFTRYIYENSEEKKDVISVETLAGIIVPTVIAQDGFFEGAEVDMGIPIIEELDGLIQIEDKKFKMNKISMGNPHCVIFVNEKDDVDVAAIGPIIENLPQFPNRTNVEFARVLNKNEIDLQVWERGAGITLACGTGACAAVVAAVSNNLTDKKVTVRLSGGDLEVEWADDKHVIMRGPAEKVFEGTINI